MKLSLFRAMTLALVGAMGVAGAVGACSATNARSSAGAGAGGGATSTGTVVGGNGNGGAGGTSGTLQLDAGAGDAGDGGYTGPPPVCDPTSCQAAGGQCTGVTCVLTENPNGVSPSTQTSLQAGGTADPAFAFLYPYDKTVFPRGLLPPTLQFAGTAPAATYVHITFPGLDYKGYFAGRARDGSPSRRRCGRPSRWPPRARRTWSRSRSPRSREARSPAPSPRAGPSPPGNLRGTIYYETYGLADPRRPRRRSAS